jgi:hypothetical protein
MGVGRREEGEGNRYRRQPRSRDERKEGLRETVLWCGQLSASKTPMIESTINFAIYYLRTVKLLSF